MQRYLPAATYFVAIGLGHLEFSLWLVRARTWGGMTFAFKDFVPAFAVGTAVVLLAWILWRALHHPQRGAWIACWVLWAAGIGLVDRYLTYSLNETAHYPQYALLAWLVARALDPDRVLGYTGRVLFWTTMLGMLDEILQYLWITRSYSDYLDFNDFVVNLLAASAGVLIYYDGARLPASGRTGNPPRLEWLVATVLTGLASAACLVGLIRLTPSVAIPPGGVLRETGLPTLYLQRQPGLYGSYKPGSYREHYWILDPASGTAALLLGGTLLAASSRRLLRPDMGSL